MGAKTRVAFIILFSVVEKRCNLQNEHEMALSPQKKISLHFSLRYVFQQTMQKTEDVFFTPTSPHTFSLLLSLPLCLIAFFVNVCEFLESLSEVKKSGDDLCR